MQYSIYNTKHYDWAIPGRTAIPGRPVARAEQAPGTSPQMSSIYIPQHSTLDTSRETRGRGVLVTDFKTEKKIINIGPTFCKYGLRRYSRKMHVYFSSISNVFKSFAIRLNTTLSE